MTTTQQYDLLIVTDATASMGKFLTGLNKAIPEILALSTLSGAFKRIGIAAYRDYDQIDDLYEWSGWNSPNMDGFAMSLRKLRGKDAPEAAKTALRKALDDLVDSTRETLILWYADAPPHHPSQRRISENQTQEVLAFPNRSIDWMTLAYEARAKRCTVFTFIQSTVPSSKCFYALLSQVTGGICFEGNARNSSVISRTTLDVLLTWMGNPPAALDTAATGTHWTQVSFATVPPAEQGALTEVKSQSYLPRVEDGDGVGGSPQQLLLSHPLALTTESITQSAFQINNTTLANRFSDPANPDYRTAVYASLASIIRHNVVALTYNPIFGQLWRSVCKYRTPVGEIVPEREELVNLFSQQVGKIEDTTQAQEVKEWLENSYDSSEVIGEIIHNETQGTDARVMYLDLDSFGAEGVNLTRIEMLEVSRSCASSVMSKLAQIFTHAKVAEPGTVLAPKQRTIPLSLKPRSLFQIMPHLVVPGTMFSTRPALLMAVLATVVGVQFLLKPATALLQSAKGSWINPEIPENLSYEFARFILQGSPEDLASRLTPEEQSIYGGMRKYKILELNLDAEITAKVGWTPIRSNAVGDDRVTCIRCNISRSKTMMSNDSQFTDVCGVCSEKTKPSQEWFGKEADEMESCWVECSVKKCRAQYVVVNPAALRVRPKCWYCRNNEACPFVECTRCYNRTIIPSPYQQDIDLDTYLCVGCKNSSRQTIVDEETTTRGLIAENGVEWLGIQRTSDTFTNKSAFKLIQAHTPSFFALSEPSSSPDLLLRDRRILEASAVVGQIFDRVKQSTVELGTCALCFENIPHARLRPACGRSGCRQSVDDGCIRSWYGANQSGHLLNLMQLLCPFCRRTPAPKTMAKFNPQAGTLGGVKEAIADRGFYYAWCGDCGFAKRGVERSCVVGERLPTVRDFICEECQEMRRRRMQEPTKVAQFTPCPNCGVHVEKTFGCNHIACVCGTHFCHVCGIKSNPNDIYDHMADEHGGIYDGQNDEWSDELGEDAYD